jgi:hypothetical protein
MAVAGETYRCYCGTTACKVWVSRRTMYRHLLAAQLNNHRDRLVAPDEEQLPRQGVEDLPTAEYTEQDYGNDIPVPAPIPVGPTIDGWFNPVYNPDDPHSDITLGELLIMFFEWMTTYTVTDACAKGAYTIFRAMVPPNSNSGTWAQAKSLLENIHEQRVIPVDLCPNDCIAFYDCQHPKLQHYQHSHRTFCPECGADRYITVGGVTRPAKRGYHLPVGPWLRDGFASEALRKERAHDSGTVQPPGHVSRSNGFNDKVLNNPAMNADARNKALIGMSDGIPMFKDRKSASVTPIALRDANLPDHISMKFRHIHLTAVYPHQFWSHGSTPDNWRINTRKPKTLTPLMYVMTDDLLFWEDGQTVTDTSRRMDDPERDFTLRTILLYWCGDYPGLGEATGFNHGVHRHMCHWCHIEGHHSTALKRSSYGDYVRWTHEDHPFRTDPTFGPRRPYDTHPPPPNRTHAEAREQGIQGDNYKGPKTSHPEHTTGIKHECPLCYLYLFNIIWDVCPDMMHIIKNFFEKVVLKLMGGQRIPQWSQYHNRHHGPEEHKRQRMYFKEAVRKARNVVFTEAQRKEIDRRVACLVGPQKWIKPSMVQPVVCTCKYLYELHTG